jgi:hypothetical protein
MHVIRVYLGDMRIRYNDKREVAERLYSVREAGGQDREGKVGGCEELLGCERRSSVSVAHATTLARVFGRWTLNHV